MGLLNTTSILDYQSSFEYVSIESCKAYVHNTAVWVWIMGLLFLLAWVCFCWLLYRYRKKTKEWPITTFK